MPDTGYLTEKQVDQLLAPINPARVEDLRGMSYLAQHDVRAHLTRIFGFGRWSSRVISSDFIFEEQDTNKRWKTAYRVTVELSIHAPDGTLLAVYQDCHVSGNAPQPDRAEAHALALTSAVSTGLKRCATNLGDQFGLSLYEKGQKTAIVKGLVDRPAFFGSDSEPVAQPERAVNEISDDDHAVYQFVNNLDDIKSADLPGGERILRVAGLKAGIHKDLLDRIVQTDDGPVTLGVLADRVAGGR